MFEKKSFPEPTHSKHAPDGDGSKPAFIKSSRHAKHGHTDHADRMPQPSNDEFPMDESGEGTGN